MRAYLYRIIAVSLLLALTLSEVQAGGFSAGIGGLNWSPDGKSLLYSDYKDGIFVITPTAGSEPRRIADIDIFDTTPQWSPDGKSMISTIEVNNQAGIFRTPIKGGEPQALTEDVGWRPAYFAPNGMQPHLSPDGKWIAFLSLREGDAYTSLYLMTADGDDEHLLSHSLYVQDFVWSPGSKTIIMIADANSEGRLSDLYIMTIDGKIQLQLTTTQDVDNRYTPAWTPDGKHLLFTAMTDNNKGRIEVIDGNFQNLLRRVLLDQANEPILSPDDNYLLFSSWQGDDSWSSLSIMSMNATESDAVNIRLPGERAYYSAAWSPDSSQIAFVSFLFDDPKSESITLVNADGTNPQTLVSFPIS